MLILLPIITVLAGVNMVLFIVTICFSVLNLAFYVLPANTKLLFMKKRLLFVYLPTLVLIAIAVWDFIDMLVHLKVFEVLSFLLHVACLIQAVSFSLLVSKVAQSNPSLLA